MTTKAEQIAISSLAYQALEVRSLVQDWLRANPKLQAERRPQSTDPAVLAVAAGVVEILCERTGQTPPEWSASIGPVRDAVYLVNAASRSEKLRQRVERESPKPLRSRNVFAPAGYLDLV